MRKFILFLAIFFLSITIVEATQICKTYTYANDTAAAVIVNVSVATIIPGVHKILSFTVIPTPARNSFGAWAALYDATTNSTRITLLGEAESLAKESKNKFFPYPKSMAQGLSITVGPYTAIIVEYVR